METNPDFSSEVPEVSKEAHEYLKNIAREYLKNNGLITLPYGEYSVLEYVRKHFKNGETHARNLTKTYIGKKFV